jgi:hypothetical protein
MKHCAVEYMTYIGRVLLCPIFEVISPCTSKGGSFAFSKVDPPSMSTTAACTARPRMLALLPLSYSPPLAHSTMPTSVPSDFQILTRRRSEAGTNFSNIFAVRSLAPSPSMQRSVCALREEGGLDMICSQMSTRESELIALARCERMMRQFSSCQSWMIRRMK